MCSFPREELHFFSDDSLYEKGLEWYAQHFVAAGHQTAIGEKTATYSYLPDVPSRIRAHLPSARLLWVFREPVARTYSHYWHSAKHGSEPLSFDEAIHQESARVERDIWRGYQRRSLYADQVARYLEVFPREQMLFVLFEDLVSNPEQTVNDVYAFLGVRETYRPPRRHLHSNVTLAPRSTRVQWMARRVFGRGTRGWNVVQRVNRRRTPGYPTMTEATRRLLQTRFEEPNRRLADLTGLDLSPWSQA